MDSVTIGTVGTNPYCPGVLMVRGKPATKDEAIREIRCTAERFDKMVEYANGEDKGDYISFPDAALANMQLFFLKKVS